MDRCQGLCDCDKDSCDVSKGCTPITTGTHITFKPLQTTQKDLGKMALTVEKLGLARAC